MNVTRGFIDACEQERLHLSGAIQPHGALLVVDAALTITHASRNVFDWLGETAEQLVGGALPEHLEKALTQLGTAPGERLTHNALRELEEEVALAAVRGDDGHIMIELLPATGSHPDQEGQSSARGGDWSTFRNDTDVALARETLVSALRQYSGFDRVLYYTFLHGGNGEVIAEATSQQAQGSYLGLRFPASDIPQVARALYAKNPWRTIPDAQADSVELVGLTSSPPDLSLVDLRSVSPVHQHYMGNMGVQGAVSFPLLVANKLAGLISLHAYTPRRLSPLALRRLSDEVKRFEFARRDYEARQRMELIDTIERRFDAMRRHLAEQGSLEAAWPTISRWLMDEFEAHGVMLDNGRDLFTEGLCLEPEALEAVSAWCESDGTLTRISESLARECPDMPLSEVAGLLATSIPLKDGRRLRLFLCRAEEIHEVAWGGNPDKPAENSSGAHPIAPRRSFERWVEKRMGYSRPWPSHTQLKLLKLRVLSTALGHDE
ncbi:GAF domain-containing protein [Halomonas sp. MA07-2]|uniref:GAF domain-containing protein n=1 Tax=Halomonas sp. MA07-2 TaxID=3440841 RepID=UPI003EE9E505